VLPKRADKFLVRTISLCVVETETRRVIPSFLDEGVPTRRTSTGTKLRLVAIGFLVLLVFPGLARAINSFPVAPIACGKQLMEVGPIRSYGECMAALNGHIAATLATARSRAEYERGEEWLKTCHCIEGARYYPTGNYCKTCFPTTIIPGFKAIVDP
jgi:hypothetical protein